MASVILNTLIQNDKKFSINFKIGNYDSSVNSAPILDIWSDLIVDIKQEEKQNAYLYLYHEVKRIDNLDSISKYYYNTTNYWWLILLVNECSDPFDFFEDSLTEGVSIKILKSQFLSKIIKPNTSLDIFNFLRGRTNV